MTKAVAWLSPWYGIEDDAMQAGLARQLQVEISARHVLFGESVRLIARRQDTDDALFALTGGRVAEVHLTWRSGTEEDPRWPATAIYASLEDWVHKSMVPLHEELSNLGRR